MNSRRNSIETPKKTTVFKTAKPRKLTRKKINIQIQNVENEPEKMDTNVEVNKKLLYISNLKQPSTGADLINRLGKEIILKNCSHIVHTNCMLIILKYNGGDTDNLICPYKGCDKFLTKTEINLLMLTNKDKTKEKVNINKNHHLQQLTELADVDLVANTEEFNCKICFDDIQPGEGVRLHECLHDFCKNCLILHIKNSKQPTVKCPYMDNDYNCELELQQREIKQLLSNDDYNEYLQKGIIMAEMTIKNSFHCKTPNCNYFWELENKNNLVNPNAICAVCNKINCFKCETIHHPLTCKEYNQSKSSDQSKAYVNNILDTKKAMLCSNCGAVVEKIEGCDGIVCLCKTLLCWATKGPRWGPKGEGDTSGGCHCDYKNNKPCVPGCKNCH